MTDAFGYRAVFSVLLAATNAVVEPDLAALRVPGVTNQTYRFPFPGLPPTVEDLTELMGPTADLALACEPDRIVVGYTPECMADGTAAASRLRSFVENRAGLPVTLASHAVTGALEDPWRSAHRTGHAIPGGSQPQRCRALRGTRHCRSG